MRRSTLPVLILAALTFFSSLGRGAISDSDEAFYAEASREMVQSGDWLTPYYNEETRFQKPVLYYWFTSALFLVTGPTEWTARLGSALAGVGLVLVTVMIGRRWIDDATGLVAGAIVATSFGYFALARMALPDLPLAFFISLAIAAALIATLDRERRPRPWLLIAAASTALGFLVKGPLALALPALVVMPTLLIERRSFNLRMTDVALALLVFLAIGAPWYVAMWLTHGNDYLQSFFVGDNFERFATSRFNDPRPWWYYLPVAAGGLLPWTPLAVVWVQPVLRFLMRRQDVSTVDLRFLLWAALMLAFFTLSVGKQPRYILPVLPPLALLLASAIVERTSEWRSLDGARSRPRPNRTIVAGCTLAGLFLIALAALLHRAAPLFTDVALMLLWGVAVTTGCAGLVVAGTALSSKWHQAPTVLALAAAVVFAVLPYAVLSAPRDSAVVRMARHVVDARRDEAIATYKAFVRNLIFYTHIKQTNLADDQHLLDWVGEQRTGGLIVMPAADVARIETHSHISVQRIAEVLYFDDGGLRARTLLWPDPARDLEKVVLVRASLKK